MPRPKSILQRVTIDRAKRAHQCQHNSAHRILAGDMRLKVSNGRSSEYFCTDCALKILESDIKKLTERMEKLQSE